jgi:CBS domain-containing protein
MLPIRQLLESKGYEVWSIPPTAPIRAALELMAEKDIGALLVMDDHDLVGIFSERDYAREVILKGKSSHDTPVDNVMTRDIHTISPAQHVQTAMTLMTEERIRHLPVIEKSKVIGVISIGDVVKSTIQQQEFLIGQLENYITGSR